MKTTKIWILAGIVSIAGAVVLLTANGLSDNMVFFLTPSELHARSVEVVGEPIRLGGQVDPGTIEWDADRTELRFSLVDDYARVSVESTGAPPAMFQEGMGVVVEGVLGADNVFRATNLMVKHSNEYAPPEHESGTEVWKTLIEDS